MFTNKKFLRAKTGDLELEICFFARLKIFERSESESWAFFSRVPSAVSCFVEVSRAWAFIGLARDRPGPQGFLRAELLINQNFTGLGGPGFLLDIHGWAEPGRAFFRSGSGFFKKPMKSPGHNFLFGMTWDNIKCAKTAPFPVGIFSYFSHYLFTIYLLLLIHIILLLEHLFWLKNNFKVVTS